MLKHPFALIAALALVPALLAAEAVAPTAPTNIFNGRDLSGWTKIVKQGESAEAGTWTVADGVIRCTGQPFGYIRTEGRYKNYRLTVEWRWTGPDLPPDKQGRLRMRNSGVLLHIGGADAVWPRSVEAQLMQTNAGDIFDIGNVGFAELAVVRQKAVAAAGADAEAAKRAQAQRRVPRTQAPSEKAIGEWNTYEIICAGDTMTLLVNGVEQNRATQMGVTEGHIALQSEGAPVEFRNVRLTPLK